MLIVDTKKPEPAWTPVLGAEVLFDPIDRAMLRRARRAALQTLGTADDGAEADPDAQIEELGDALSFQLIMAGARDWRGVFAMADDTDSGAGDPLPFSGDMLARALSDPVTFEAFDVAYVRPFATRERERAAPGNGFAASPNGTGEKEKAERVTAPSPAPASAAAATSARTGSTKPKPTRKKLSGRS